MKCRSCDDILTDQEAVRKDSHGVFVDLCFECYPVDPDIVNPVEEEEIDQFLQDEVATED